MHGVAPRVRGASGAIGKLTTLARNGLVLKRFGYDVEGNLAKVAVEGSDVAEYDYDTRGNLVAERILAAGRDVDYVYDEQGRLREKAVRSRVTLGSVSSRLYYDYGLRIGGGWAGLHMQLTATVRHFTSTIRWAGCRPSCDMPVRCVV